MPKTPEERAAEQEAIRKTEESERNAASGDSGTEGNPGPPPAHLPEDVGRHPRREPRDPEPR